MRTSRAAHLGVALWLVASVAGCGDDDAPLVDGGADAGPTCEATFTFEVGDPDGHAEPLGAGPTEARAGRLAASALPADPQQLSTVRAGDFVLANDRIAVIVEDVGLSDHYVPWGGALIGLGRVEGGAIVDPADFGEVITAFGRFTLEADSVTVLADGSAGGAAVVRAAGHLSPIPFVDEFAHGLAPREYGDLAVAIDYTLQPGATTVDITFDVASTRGTDAVVLQQFTFFAQLSRMPRFVPGFGFAGGENESTPWIGLIDEDGTSYAWAAPTGDVTPFLTVSGVAIYDNGDLTVPGCARTRLPFARLHVGVRPGLDGLVASMAEAQGDAVRTITGTLSDASAAPVAGAHVHAEQTDGTYLTRDTTAADGTFTLTVPASAAVRVSAVRRGDPTTTVDVAATATTADLAFPAQGFVHVVARDADTGTPIPARVQVLPTGGLTPTPDAWGEARAGATGRLYVEFPVSGDVTLGVPPGEHRVIVSRGYEYDLVDDTLTVAAGATVEVPADLERVVATPGVMCGDFHLHTTRSPDSEDDSRWKIQSAIADGLEVPVRSDHEWVRDFEPEIAALGATDFAYGLCSMELTTFTWGHFGVFPLVRDDARIGGGAYDWVNRLSPAVFAEIRATVTPSGPPTIIINHPRGQSIGSYFDVADYDHHTGLVGHPENWDEAFNLIELANGSSFDSNLDGSVADWFSFLSAGRRVFALGSSDSHRVSGSPVGYPRTCIEVGTDEPAALRALGPNGVRDPLVAGHATISGGIYVTAVARGGAGPGDEVSGSSATETVEVTVRAAPWISVTSLRSYVDGALAETIPLDAATVVDPLEPAVRFRGSLDVPVTAAGGIATWAVFVAAGDAPLDPVHPGRMPFGVTNPVFFSR
jgi:hypothetical protein